MPASRCSACAINWPVPGFKKCPLCGEKTVIRAAANAMPDKEAEFMVQEERFNRYYERRERGRKGPTPEELGALEAKQQFALYRALEDLWDEEEAA